MLMLGFLNIFKWHHEHSINVNVPISRVLNFHQDMNNWPLWMDQFESFKLEKISNNKKVIIGKVKGKNYYLPFVISEIIKDKKYQFLIKSPLFFQKSDIQYFEISPEVSKIIFHTTITSYLVPFLKFFFRKKAESQYSILMKEFSKLEQDCPQPQRGDM